LRIWGTAATYQAAMERLERKFGGQRHQVVLYLEEMDSFKPVHSGTPKDLKTYWMYP